MISGIIKPYVTCKNCGSPSVPRGSKSYLCRECEALRMIKRKKSRQSPTEYYPYGLSK